MQDYKKEQEQAPTEKKISELSDDELFERLCEQTKGAKMIMCKFCPYDSDCLGQIYLAPSGPIEAHCVGEDKFYDEIIENIREDFNNSTLTKALEEV